MLELGSPYSYAQTIVCVEVGAGGEIHSVVWCIVSFVWGHCCPVNSYVLFTSPLLVGWSTPGLVHARWTTEDYYGIILVFCFLPAVEIVHVGGWEYPCRKVKDVRNSGHTLSTTV